MRNIRFRSTTTAVPLTRVVSEPRTGSMSDQLFLDENDSSDDSSSYSKRDLEHQLGYYQIKVNQTQERLRKKRSPGWWSWCCDLVYGSDLDSLVVDKEKLE